MSVTEGKETLICWYCAVSIPDCDAATQGALGSLFCVSPHQICLGPEKSVTFLENVAIWLLLCILSDAMMNCVPAHVIMLMSLNNYVGFSSLCQLSYEHSLLVFCMAKYDLSGFFKCFDDHMLRKICLLVNNNFLFLYSINLPGKSSKKEFSEHSTIFSVFITTVPTFLKHITFYSE